MIDSVAIFVVSVAILFILDIKERKSIRNTMFIISAVLGLYIGLSLIEILLGILDPNSHILGQQWYLVLPAEWITLSRITIFPEETYFGYILGVLVGIHVALINIYIAISRLFRSKEALVSVRKITVSTFGLLDGVLIGGVLGFVGVPLALVIDVIVDRSKLVDRFISRRKRLRTTSDMTVYSFTILSFVFLIATISSLIMLILSPILGIASPRQLSGIGNVDPTVKALIIGLIYGWLGGYGGIIFSVMLSLVGWFGYIENALPYGVVHPIVTSGRAISNSMGATIGAVLGTIIGWIAENTIRQWKAIKEKMKEIALKEKKTKLRMVEPRILEKIIRRGAFGQEELVGEGVTSSIINALYGSGMLDKYGDVIEVKYEKIKSFIAGIESLKGVLREIETIPTIKINNQTMLFLGKVGIKNIFLIEFDPHRGPTPVCAVRYTEFAKKLFGDPSISVNLSNISRVASEAKILDTPLVFRTYTTKHHGRDLYHIVCAEVLEESNKRLIEEIVANIAEVMDRKETTKPNIFSKAIEQATKMLARRR